VAFLLRTHDHGCLVIGVSVLTPHETTMLVVPRGTDGLYTEHRCNVEARRWNWRSIRWSFEMEFRAASHAGRLRAPLVPNGNANPPDVSDRRAASSGGSILPRFKIPVIWVALVAFNVRAKRHRDVLEQSFPKGQMPEPGSHGPIASVADTPIGSGVARLTQVSL
jgi:hypothetical protein